MTGNQFSESRSAHGPDAPPAPDPWADAAKSLREEVSRSPYLALLVAGGVGCLLGGAFLARVLPGLLDLGVRVAVASALPTLTKVAREFAAHEP